MVSIEHEALVNLFRENLELAPGLLGSLFGVELPQHEAVAPLDTKVGRLAPPGFFTDLGVELLDEERSPALAVIVEVQLAEDAAKRYSWPVYVATVRSSRRCGACVLVVAPDGAVAKWASAPIDLGPGNEAFRVLVLGPSVVPAVRDEEEARAEPELAVLSALAHGNDETVGREVLKATLAGLSSFDVKTAEVYHKVIWNSLRGPMRAEFEAMVREAEARGDLETPPVFKELQAKWQARGVAEGEARGEARGKAEGKIESLLNVLSARGLSMNDEARTRILACRDLEQLDDWIRCAVVAEKVDDIFE